jgi:hypothetical protein
MQVLQQARAARGGWSRGPSVEGSDIAQLLGRTMSLKDSIGGGAGGCPSGTSTSTLSRCRISATCSSLSALTRSLGSHRPMTAATGPPRLLLFLRPSTLLVLGVRGRPGPRLGASPSPRPPLLRSWLARSLYEAERPLGALEVAGAFSDEFAPRKCGGTYGIRRWDNGKAKISEGRAYLYRWLV